MNLTVRSYKKEILDRPDIPFADIRQNMKELNFINTWLGGHAVSIAGLKKLIGDRKSVLICEIGCGGGDNLSALNSWCAAQKIDASFIGIDIKEECIQFARTREVEHFSVKWIVSDYLKVKFDIVPDIIFSSLFCHHFTKQELIAQFTWMMKNCSVGFFINDLQRNIIAYYSIKILTATFSSSYLVKNDAPLSVLRGFKKSELMTISEEAGLKNVMVKWKWAFRYLVIYKHA